MINIFRALNQLLTILIEPDCDIRDWADEVTDEDLVAACEQAEQLLQPSPPTD
ncbi:hypothetical protein BOX15_Mlig025416g1 [Macrostomum lignano]|uniref:Uncharacterized protein n=1 Tax=Macrostomum lignano TaxID=282301 RepID=A0A267EEH2_9PLAT|nr:hypothetical protein BOX15_Mlig025416g1 [Macrostomum lignano]